MSIRALNGAAQTFENYYKLGWPFYFLSVWTGGIYVCKQKC